MAQSTDRPPGLTRDVTDEHESKAALVLADVAQALASENPKDLVDSLGFVVLTGAWAYDRAGRGCHGGRRNVLRLALRAVAERTGLDRGEVPAGVTRRAFAAEVAEAARALGYDWSSAQLGEERETVRFPVVGPSRSDESGRGPDPRPEQAVNDR